MAKHRKRGIGRTRRLLPVALVVIAITFNLWTLRSETKPAHNLNDGAMHASMIRWAEGQIESGRIPLDGWYPYLSLGVPQFHHYQSLGHFLTGYLATVIGSDLAYTWTLYLLLSLWPLSVYWGVRRLDWDRWAAGIAALVSPLLVSASGYGFEYSSYTWQGLGEWSQLWGMWLLPLALGFGWRAISKGKHFAAAALLISLAFASNFLSGYQAFVALGVFILIKPSQLIRRIGRAALLGAGAILTGAWFFVPLLADSKWANRSAYLTGFHRDSHGPSQVLRWLKSGDLYDLNRFPVVTLLVASGVVFCVSKFRSDERARALLGFWTVSLFLFFGPTGLGPLVRVLPFGNDILYLKFITGLHLAGVILAGVGAVWIGRALIGLMQSLLPRLKTAPIAIASAVLGFGLLLPAFVERLSFNARGASFVETQRFADVNDGNDLSALIDIAKGLSGGRIYSGRAGTWGRNYAIGFVPVYSELLNHDAHAVGWSFRTIFSLSHDIEVQFNETNPSHYDLFNVRYMILPSDQTPPVPASRSDSRGRHVLWEVSTGGYFGLVDTIEPIHADRTNLGAQMSGFLQSNLPAQKLHPAVTFGGIAGAPPTAAQLNPSGRAGRIDSEFNSPAEGFFSARVTAARTSVVMLKSSFHPRWRVIVDGVGQAPQMIAPSFVGARVSAGQHTVVFSYESYPHYPWLFALGVIMLALLAFGMRLIHWTGQTISQHRESRIEPFGSNQSAQR